MGDAVSTVRVGGRNIATPGGYSESDLTGAQTPSIVDSGVIALIGDAIGGEPGVVQEFDNLDAIKRAFTEVGTTDNPNITFFARLLYNGNGDSRISGAPQRVLIVKTNPDTQSTGVLQGGAGPLINLTSEDYGAQTNQINVTVTNSLTGGGIDLLIKKGSTIESESNLGGSPVMSIKKDLTGFGAPLSNGSWNVDVDPALGIDVNFTQPFDGELGVTSEVQAGWVGTVVATVVSTSASDTYQSVIVYGIDGSNVPVTETIVLDGLTPVATTQVFAKITGAEVQGLTVGDVTIEDATANVVVTFDTAAQQWTALPLAGKLDVRSSGADIGQVVVITGRNAAGSTIVNSVVLNGGTDQETPSSFDKVLNIQVQGTTTATVEVVDKNPVTVLTIAAGTDVVAGTGNTRGLFQAAAFFGGPGTIGYTSSDAGVEVVVRGVKTDGTAYAERFSGVGPSTGGELREWTHIELGAAADTQTCTITGKEAEFAITDTIETVIDRMSEVPLFTVVGFQLDRLISEMDTAALVDIKDIDAELFSATADVVDWINENSDLVTAVRVSGASGLPLATAVPVFLFGAVDGTTTNADFFAAIDALNEHEVDIIVPLTESAAVISYLTDHVTAAKATLQDERNAYVGLGNNHTIDEIDALTVVINNEDMCCVSQKVRVFDELGDLYEAPSYAAACIAAGQQASSPIGEPLTRKFVNIQGLVEEQWSPVIDSESLIRRGLMFLRFKKGKGHFWVRSITSYRKKANRILTEMSANESFNKSRQDMREYLEELLVGLPSTIANGKYVTSLATGRASFQVENNVITGFRNVTAVRTGDLIEVEYDAAAIEPTNFLRITTHVDTTAESA